MATTKLTGREAFFRHMSEVWNLPELHAVALFDDVESAEIEGQLPFTGTVNGQTVTVDLELADDGETPVWVVS